MRIAIIGTGVSGLVAAYLLHEEHELTVYEAEDYVGGHTHTVDVTVQGRTYAVDTGFIVFNERTYPNLVTLFRRLGVEWQNSCMGFSVRCERTGLEYRPTTLDTLFAQRRNIIRPSFWRMLRDIYRFRKESAELLEGEGEMTLGGYLDRRGYSREFVEHFIVPMGAAIWSAEPVGFRQFPARRFVRFFTNHGFLEFRGQPQWLVVKGGSRRYVERMTAGLGERIRTSCPVRSVRRSATGVEVTAGEATSELYDHVVIATHSDQALALLADPTDAERDILGAIAYQENVTELHTDTSLLPRRRKVWAAWNYHIPAGSRDRVAVTYDMNILQSLDAPVEFCVTLNRSESINAEKKIRSIVYAHPIYTPAAVEAQQRHAEISGVNRTHYCGAYWGNGFHEDGVNSALAVCRFFGKGL